MKNSRRTFVKSMAFAGLTIPSISASLANSRPKKLAPSDQLKVGLIGCKGMGFSNLTRHIKNAGVECIGLCDIDENVLDERSANLEKLQGKKAKTYGDYREMLDNKDIDYVIVGTPDHWHCLNMIGALDAGKHVYVEKPIAHTMDECNLMVKAAKKYEKIVQVGQWQRSGPHYEEAFKMVKSGMLGKIRLVKVWAYQGWMKPVPVLPDTAVPKGVNYDMWLGPAQKRAFNENRFHFNFRWFWDYAGGLMTDWGVHEIDIALHAMGAKAPISVMASGGKFAYPDDASETPDTLQTVFQYDGFNMLWEHATGIDGGNYGKTEGIAFIGNNGTLVVHRGGWELIPETYTENKIKKNKVEPLPTYIKKPEDDYLYMHAENFIKAIRNNDPSSLNCGIETGSVAAINAIMGNVSYKLGRKVFWDAEKGNFKNDKEANALMVSDYKNGWKLPKV
ncbi:gfo/Idh/MocA family oxidoreductase [Lacihabitans sp. LS3-19]|uniref:Gfo/Idh/MocA family protein n=1 Tax=Lacihabitans sp. LS3-19 TaxID=2487335 RepID=UPI0020CC7272|nr:Gfo/Idh/MocA family oxidoreductase [Lacihabitans sp. LS3-19]MCP9768747.1 gfo/Idh/MocA family oxidoreductase [Lacihabitans sp. LS3-19]